MEFRDRGMMVSSLKNSNLKIRSFVDINDPSLTEQSLINVKQEVTNMAGNKSNTNYPRYGK